MRDSLVALSQVVGRSKVIPCAAPLHVVEVADDAADHEDALPRSKEGARARPAREIFVLVHGYGGTSYLWRHWAQPLAKRGRVLLIDLKGFGDAPKPDDGRYTPRDLADAVVALILELDLTRVTLVGQSLGGGVALLVALSLQDRDEPRLARLILVAAAAYPQRLPPLVPMSKRPRLSEALIRLVGPKRLIRWATRAIVHDPGIVTEEQVAAYARPLETREGRRAAMDVGRRIVPDNLEQIVTRYPEIQVPTLLLWGDSDRVVPLWVGRRLEREMPRARLVVVGECGHLAPEERPVASLQAVERFVEEYPL
ncbi:MAG: alpha/beta hydrolase [Gemmatimonadota bacterium]|nr:alpha/beta hydrolase [Gemmatimonadota bacterium]